VYQFKTKKWSRDLQDSVLTLNKSPVIFKINRIIIMDTWNQKFLYCLVFKIRVI